MRSGTHSRLIFVVLGVLALAITVSAIFSRAQQESASDIAMDQLAALMAAQTNAWITNRAPHPACPNCFRIADGRYGVFEEVPGTGVVLTRDIPDPAPLEPGEIRPEFDEEGQPIWYKGHQGYVGPTDEEPLSAELPVPKIELMRIKARHERKVFSIRGVNLFGIGAKGFRVRIDPKYRENRLHIPSDLEGVPVEIEEGEMSVVASHQNQSYRPVPLGVGIWSASKPPLPGSNLTGTLGPHVIREAWNDIGACCQILSLTATHVVKHAQSVPLTPDSPGAVIYQGVSSWGTVALSFRLNPCGTPGNSSGCYVANPVTNDMRLNPDVAAIAHLNTLHRDPYPQTPPCSGSQEPTRKMQYGATSYVHGPSGLIRIATPGISIKMWGTVSDAPKGTVDTLGASIVVLGDDNYYYCYTPMDSGSIQLLQPGDSGALVAWNGEATRHVTGLAVSGRLFWPYRVDYIRADDIQVALQNAGMSFDHYWGTNSTVLRPSSTQYDNPC